MVVGVVVTAVILGCRDTKAPTPNVPPAFAVPARPVPPPLPPEERTTTVFPLDSNNCGAQDRTYIDHTIAEVLARCIVTGNTTRVVLTVSSRATDPLDYLLAVSQRFCGDVIDAKGPEGWEVAVERETGLHDVAGEVTWKSTSIKMGQPTQRRISDFSVTLQGEWRTGMGHYLAFTRTAGPVTMSPHDCPYPFK
jgi:hypothetical protein